MKKSSSLEKRFALLWLACKGPRLTREFKFHSTRKWRFDFVVEGMKVAFELEGGTWVGGAHGRGIRYQSDCEKYNEAAMLGWTVFRLTGDMLGIPYVERLREWCDAYDPSP